MTATITHSPTAVQWLPIGQLDIDPRINRPLDTRRVDNIARDFDPDALGVLTVSARESGQYVLIDGQHRAASVRQLGWGDEQRVPCDVRPGLTLAEEARLFVNLNNTAKPTAIYRFLRRVTAGEDVAVAINHIVALAGLEVSDQPGDGRINAVVAMERVYSGTGALAREMGPYPDALEGSLRILTEAFGRTDDAVRGPLVQGVGALLVRYGPAVDRASLVARLSKLPVGANGLLSRARGMHEYQGGSLPRCVSEVCVGLYNGGRRTRRLDDWR